MNLKPWAKAALVIVASLASVGIGFAAFRAPIQQQIVKQSAMHAFGQGKLNVLILGYQDDEETTDTIILAHLDVDRRTSTRRPGRRRSSRSRATPGSTFRGRVR